MSTPNFLMIGASGRMGLSLIRAASSHPSHPPIHAFCRTPSKLPPPDRAACASVQQGDALSPADIEAALDATQANVVLVSLGVPNDTAPSDLRTKSAQALYSVLTKERFGHVRVVVVSVVGARESTIDFGWGVGMVVTFWLRHLLKDHDGQEEVLERLGERCWIVRPMGLADGEGEGVVEFVGRAGKLSMARTDLGVWIVGEVLGGREFGGIVQVTGKGWGF